MSEAEVLLAERGYRGMTLRVLAERAAVNLAAVHYHFGSKQKLFMALLRRRIEPINRERLVLLEKAREAEVDSRTRVTLLVEALLLPMGMAFQTEDARRRMAMMGRCMWETPELHRQVHRRFFKTVVERFYAAFEEVMPSLPPAELGVRFKLMMGTLIGTLVMQDYTIEGMPEMVVSPGEPGMGMEGMVAFITAGMWSDQEEASA